ncbi:hypothetical protein [Desulfosporosinus sp. FKA]|nr:hypothetical protein [Desulfosporosinus sp. FKA]
MREWSPDHTKMGKGITITRAELGKLRDIQGEKKHKIGSCK